MNYQDQQKHYEKLWAKVKDWEFEDTVFKNRIPSKEVQDFIQFLKKKKITKGKVLDLGCGGGRNAVEFAKAGFDVYGIDFSEKAITLAKKHAKDSKVKVEFVVGTVLNLPYTQQFDIIIDLGTFHHIIKKDWQIYINNILKVLKPNGQYLLYVFNVKTPQLCGIPITAKKPWIIKNAHYTHFFSNAELDAIFSKNFIRGKTLQHYREDKNRYFTTLYMTTKKS